MIPEILPLKGHHPLCTILYVREGYEESYMEMMDKLIEYFNNNPKQKIILAEEQDIMCESCPHNIGRCKKQDKVTVIVDKILTLCDLKIGDEMTWEDLERITIDKIITNGNLIKVCGTCSYYEQCSEKAKSILKAEPSSRLRELTR